MNMPGDLREGGWPTLRSALETNRPMRLALWWQFALLLLTLIALQSRVACVRT